MAHFGMEALPQKSQAGEVLFSIATTLDPHWSHDGRFLTETEEGYRLASQLGSNEAQCFMNLGLLYQAHLGRPEESERAYLRAIELDPKVASRPYNLGSSTRATWSVRRSGPTSAPSSSTRSTPPPTTTWATCTRPTWAGTRSRSGPTSAPSSSTRSSPTRTTAWADCTRPTWVGTRSRSGPTSRHRARPEVRLPAQRPGRTLWVPPGPVRGGGAGLRSCHPGRPEVQ